MNCNIIINLSSVDAYSILLRVTLTVTEQALAILSALNVCVFIRANFLLYQEIVSFIYFLNHVD